MSFYWCLTHKQPAVLAMDGKIECPKNEDQCICTGPHETQGEAEEADYILMDKARGLA